MNINQWDAKRQRVKGTKATTKVFNTYLEEVRADLFHLYRSLLRKHNNVTVQLIKSYYLGEHKEKHSLIDIFEFHNDTFSNKLAPKTICHYRTNQKYILNHVQQVYGQKDFPLGNLDYQFVLGFESFFR